MRPEKRMTLDASVADFVVDVANVVRYEALEPAGRPGSLARFLALLEGLAEFTVDDAVQVYPVTDGSLLREKSLTAEDHATLRGWAREGLLEVEPIADDRILELADRLQLPVVSRDGFRDYCRRYPWIPGSRDRFLVPRPGPDGSVRVVRRTMPVPEEWQISRKEEESALLAAGLYDRRGGSGPRKDLLERLWRCPEEGCPVFGPGRTGGQPLPRRAGDGVHCPTHRAPLEDLGPAPRHAQFKLVVDGRVRLRFLVPEGAEVSVGRAPEGEGIALAPWLDGEARRWISRSHAVLAYRGGNLTVQDTSANGTRVRRRRPGAGSTVAEEVVEVPSGKRAALGRNHAVLLHDRVELVPSGRQFLFDPGPEGTVPPPAAESEADSPTMVYGAGFGALDASGADRESGDGVR